MARRLQAFNLYNWLDEHRHELVPPVGNKLIHAGEFKVMVVAGPNSRTDYHIEEGEEWFYQLEGVLTLRVIDDESFYDVVIKTGDTFCLPARVPHSPQRAPGSIGLVVERERRPGELDALAWYCQSKHCRALLHRADFVCTNLEKDLKPIIEDYFADEAKRTCKKCGFVEKALTK